MTLMIDNYDSFTYNIYHYLKAIGEPNKIIKNDELSIKQISRLKFDHIIFSPGPDTPAKSGICMEVLGYFVDKLPILGICLGHQIIAQYFGAKIIKHTPMHGKISTLDIINHASMFADIPNHIKVARYHSLVVDEHSLSKCLQVTSYAKDDNQIMSLKVKNKPIFGIQFHPESYVSEYGHQLLKNFINV